MYTLYNIDSIQECIHYFGTPCTSCPRAQGNLATPLSKSILGSQNSLLFSTDNSEAKMISAKGFCY